MLDTSLRKKRAAGLVILAVLLVLFLAFNRLPKLDTVRGDLEVVSAVEVECFQGFCIEDEPDSTLLERWWGFSATYMRLVAVGMAFAFLVAGLTESFLFPRSGGPGYSWGGPIKGGLKGLAVGPIWNLCSACIVPVSTAFARRGAGPQGAVAIAQGSSTLNLPALVMAAFVFTPLVGGSRVVLGLAAGLLIPPLVARIVGERSQVVEDSPLAVGIESGESSRWRPVLAEAFRDWARSTAGHVLRLGPVMVLAGFASGLAVQWLSQETVEAYLGNDVQGIVIAATLGILVNVPLMFEIPLVALLMLLGMGTAPAATLLFAAAAGGPITFWGFAKLMPKRGVLAFAASTWAVGVAGGVVVLGLSALKPAAGPALDAAFIPPVPVESGLSPPVNGSASVAPFRNVSPLALDDGYWVRNYRPGVAVFDYDRDGDLDFYVTSEAGYSNFLYDNRGDGTFANVAELAGAAALETNGSGVVACDVNNDGYQDLYLGGRGIKGDKLDYRSALGSGAPDQGLYRSIQDRLLVNTGTGSFTDVTEHAFGDAVNVRSAGSAACADVDGDGWLDIYVGNMVDEDFFKFNNPSHPGHYNVLYLNNSDLTFREVAESAGVRGGEISMRDEAGRPLLFGDPVTGRMYEGYDPTKEDANGNRIGDPTSRTHAVLFFDHDDDGDPDLWLANDGDRLQVFRNDSLPGAPRFVSITEEMGIGRVGNWMGFAVGDYDADADLDLFVTNVGFHLRLGEPQEEPGGDCKYQERFEWGTCLHALLRNDGVREAPGLGTVPTFRDVAPSTTVVPSPYMPPASLFPENINSAWEVPTGLAAYDFGYGTTFFDFDNDGRQDLYWLGSEIARGAGPGGSVYPSAGRMLRGSELGSFEDITVRAQLLDILGVGYSTNGSDDPRSIGSLTARRIDPKFHENGKGLAHGDLNGDGFVDLIGTNSSGPVWEGVIGTMTHVDGPLFVWMNSGKHNNWINIRLRGRMAVDGTGTNADGIGARVFVKTQVEGEEPLLQIKEVRAGSSYISMDSLDLEFGIGRASMVERIVVLWPSGRRQVLEDVSADQSILIVEPAE